MRFTIEAACGCNRGKIRSNNEDNFFFDGKCLESENDGLKHPVSFECDLRGRIMRAVFDGMGGENYGEIASFSAARKMQSIEKKFADFFISDKKYLKRLTAELNEAVLGASRELLTSQMGTTMVSLSFGSRSVYVCNVGDSRAYCLRDGAFMQISTDHTDVRPGREGKKAPLTQHLGIPEDVMVIEPYIARGELKHGDKYLICSDGLTDMLTNLEIATVMIENEDTEKCVEELIANALDRGGRDNVTAIVVKIS